MKRNVKMTGLLWSLLFVLGGMFLTVESQAQTNSAQLFGSAPNGKTWIATQQANQVVDTEIAFLTNKLNQLILNQAPDKDIKIAKRELQFWMNIKEYLNQGLLVGVALEKAWADIASPTKVLNGQNADPGKKVLVQQIYDKALSKLTI